MKIFSLNEKEEKEAKEFIEKHKDCTLFNNEGLKIYYTGFAKFWRKLLGKPLFKYKPGPYPPHFVYIFSNESGIGTGITIRCNYCGEEKDITDYGSW